MNDLIFKSVAQARRKFLYSNLEGHSRRILSQTNFIQHYHRHESVEVHIHLEYCTVAESSHNSLCYRQGTALKGHHIYLQRKKKHILRVSPCTNDLSFFCISYTISLFSFANLLQYNYTYAFTCLKFLQTCELAAFPFMALATMVLARDLELPGFPTRNRGILSSIQTTIIKTFSLKALFLAMFVPKLSVSKKTF